MTHISYEEATGEIVDLFLTGRTLYYSDIIAQLGLDLRLVVGICDELEASGEIAVDAGKL